MKKLNILPYLLNLILLLFLLNINCYSQERKLSVYPALGIDLGGATPFPFSDIPDGAGGTPEPYPFLGLGAEYPVSGNWKIAAEVNYRVISFTADADVISQPYYPGDGSKLYFSGETYTDVELRMVEFPLVGIYQLRDSRAVLFGIYYSIILEGTFNTDASDGVINADKSITDNAILPGSADANYDFSEFLDNYDYGILLGYRYKLSDKMNLYGRIQVGFKSIFKPDFDNIDYEMYQVRLNIGASYRIF
ncbi:MAG: hypothetical protein A2X13_02075 [Bacteroidetes bacterium GWC2_33_15]|nr:MAG: hypothetical protein A2X10_07550 [Bacteroidetes bacterium GWA2_33_15]OFX52266.1 MAG: hypothetical protein A2X13_02075 [Bacteroidetes bacterium GWC2_33_15]OFX64420.1 MAG: hypothetical protein A2X15_12895 [Bacteroidetes bacterium GWB2_32_14]OFX67825.1 MAG: hypothetical protein A2X14_06720 [Bacteroidetes bacterium GWD2_33_33]HAN19439.1 hypothetical protein [Bacteroidales bacterium]